MMCTNSSSGCSNARRNARRPMRPKRVDTNGDIVSGRVRVTERTRVNETAIV